MLAHMNYKALFLAASLTASSAMAQDKPAMDCNSSATMAEHMRDILSVDDVGSLTEEQNNIIKNYAFNSPEYREVWAEIINDAAERLVSLTAENDVGFAYVPYATIELACAINDKAGSPLELDMYIRDRYRLALAKILLAHAQSPEDFNMLFDTLALDDGRKVYGDNDYISEFFYQMNGLLDQGVINSVQNASEDKPEVIRYLGQALLQGIEDENPYIRGNAYYLLSTLVQQDDELVPSIITLIDSDHSQSSSLFYVLENKVKYGVVAEPGASIIYDFVLNYLESADENTPEQGQVLNVLSHVLNPEYSQSDEVMMLLREAVLSVGSYREEDRKDILEVFVENTVHAIRMRDDAEQDRYLSMWEGLLSDENFQLPYGTDDLFYDIFTAGYLQYATQEFEDRADKLNAIMAVHIDDMYLRILTDQQRYSNSQRVSSINSLLREIRYSIYEGDSDKQDRYLTLWEEVLNDDSVTLPIAMDHFYLQAFNPDDMSFGTDELVHRASVIKDKIGQNLSDGIIHYFRQTEASSEAERMDVAVDMAYTTMQVLQGDYPRLQEYYLGLWADVFEADSVILPIDLQDYFYKAFGTSQQAEMPEEAAEAAANLIFMIDQHFQKRGIDHTPQP